MATGTESAQLPQSNATAKWLQDHDLGNSPLLEAELTKLVDHPDEICELTSADIATLLEALKLGGVKKARLNKIQAVLERAASIDAVDERMAAAFENIKSQVSVFEKRLKEVEMDLEMAVDFVDHLISMEMLERLRQTTQRISHELAEAIEVLNGITFSQDLRPEKETTAEALLLAHKSAQNMIVTIESRAQMKKMVAQELFQKDSRLFPLRIALLGKTGDGKSALGNALLGREAFKSANNIEASPTFCSGKSNLCIKSESRRCVICISVQSVTTRTTMDEGKWLGYTGRSVYIIDTPGLNDSENRDKAFIEASIDFLKKTSEGVHVFCIVFKSVNIRYAMHQQLLGPGPLDLVAGTTQQLKRCCKSLKSSWVAKVMMVSHSGSMLLSSSRTATPTHSLCGSRTFHPWIRSPKGFAGIPSCMLGLQSSLSSKYPANSTAFQTATRKFLLHTARS